MNESSMSNIKGGVGKTTSELNLVACLAPNISTLLVDLDPQGACALSIGVDSDELDQTVYEVLLRKCTPREAILSTPFGFDLLPSNIELSKAEIALVNMVMREYVIGAGRFRRSSTSTTWFCSIHSHRSGC